MANKRFGEDFIEFTAPPKDDDMLLMLSSDDKKTYKTKRSELFRNVNVEYTIFQFAKNATKTVAPKVGWTEAPPITEDNEWLWIRQGKIAPLTSSLPVWSAPVRIKGEQGTSEVYVGKTPPTDGTFQIAIDPDGDLNGGIPAGGRTGDVLTKTSNSDYATTWSSPLRPLFIARGAVWNASTGFYELNGLTDITEAQMIEIYEKQDRLSHVDCRFAFALGTDIRTNFAKKTSTPGFTASLTDFYGAFSLNKTIEVINMQNNPRIKDLRFFVTGCPNLSKIIGLSPVHSEYTSGSYDNAFNNCPVLSLLEFSQVRFDLNIAQSPLLTRDSIIYVINNAANTSPITVTLHPEAKARLTGEDIALASSKNITLTA